MQIKGILSVLGRLFLTTIFLMSAIGNKIPQFNSVAEMMAAEGVPMPKIMLAGAIVFLIVGGLSVLLGYKARIGAALLAIFLVLATWYFHDFWTMEGQEAQQQMIHFMKNLSMFGAMLFIMANGSGAWSLDECLAAKAKSSSESEQKQTGGG